MHQCLAPSVLISKVKPAAVGRLVLSGGRDGMRLDADQWRGGLGIWAVSADGHLPPNKDVNECQADRCTCIMGEYRYK
jgi:hypothetical protein